MRTRQSLKSDFKIVDIKFLVLNGLDKMLDELYLDRLTRKELIMNLVSLKEDVLNYT